MSEIQYPVVSIGQVLRDATGRNLDVDEVAAALNGFCRTAGFRKKLLEQRAASMSAIAPAGLVQRAIDLLEDDPTSDVVGSDNWVWLKQAREYISVPSETPARGTTCANGIPGCDCAADPLADAGKPMGSAPSATPPITSEQLAEVKDQCETGLQVEHECPAMFALAAIYANLFAGEPPTEAAPILPPADANGKRPRLFYWEDSEGAWCPAEGLEVDNIITADIFLRDGDEEEIAFKRMDMTDAEFDAIPEG